MFAFSNFVLIFTISCKGIRLAISVGGSDFYFYEESGLSVICEWWFRLPIKLEFFGELIPLN